MPGAPDSACEATPKGRARPGERARGRGREGEGESGREGERESGREVERERERGRDDTDELAVNSISRQARVLVCSTNTNCEHMAYGSEKGSDGGVRKVNWLVAAKSARKSHIVQVLIFGGAVYSNLFFL